MVWYVGGMVRWYGTAGIFFMTKFAWWYGMSQYIGSLRVEYVARTSSVTTLNIDHWKVFEHIIHADRHAGRQTDKFAFTVAQAQF